MANKKGNKKKKKDESSSSSSSSSDSDNDQPKVKASIKNHLREVLEDIGTAEEPKAGEEMKKFCEMMVTKIEERFPHITTTHRVKYLNDRIEGLMKEPIFKQLVILISNGKTNGGITKTTEAWMKELFITFLHEIRALIQCYLIAKSNIPFDSYDFIIAQQQASQKLLEMKGLKKIGEGAEMSWGSKFTHAQKLLGENPVKGEATSNTTTTSTGVTPTPKEAPKPPPKANTEDRTWGATCDYCGKTNHLEEQCKIKKREEAERRRKERLQRKEREREDRERREKRERSKSRERRPRSRSRSPPPAPGGKYGRRSPHRRN